ncbi:uncharacterized protein LOC112494915 [Cephus cinctus]|uniref:Uncharacterized protein LOC112494915 n=1 Tax=Cephus cinctus TaxID=211228 RepID=A0AAJ7W4R1_CEPCN|nr:uncharacterized protein LOC112494915 [Cephus cinctus]
MDRYTMAEKVDMIYIYGETQKNARAACNLYAERYPERNNPCPRTFDRIVQLFSKTGSVVARKKNRSRTITVENSEIAILTAVDHDPEISSRKISTLHQELHGDDFEHRVQFCQWALQQMQDENFYVLYSDESGFTNHGQVNRHNMYYWATENPRWLRQVEHQRPWTLNVRCGVYRNRIVGSYFLEDTLTGQKYKDFLDRVLSTLLEDIPLLERSNMWYQHDGCPAHFSFQAREILDRDYADRWIGRRGPVHWPARSPDLTSPDFFLWGYINEKVYKEVPTTCDNMRQCIIDASANIEDDTLLSVQRSYIRRYQKCIEVNSQHFEHLL